MKLATIPLFRVQSALMQRNQRSGHPQHLHAVFSMINVHGICPRTVALPRTVTYDGYGRIYR